MDIYQRIIFFTVVFSVLFSLQLLVYKTFRKYLLKKNIDVKTANYLSRIPFLFFSFPYIIQIFKSFDLFMPPDWMDITIIKPFFVFQAATFFIGLFLVVGKIIKMPFVIGDFLLKRINFLRDKYHSFRNKKKVVKFDESRRKFITASTTLVSGYAFIGAGVGTIQKDKYIIEEKNIKIPGLLAEQKGITAVLISDIHSGPYMDFDQMKEYVDVINDLKPDMIFIPGDLTNSQRNEAAPFAKAFRDLKAKYGVYATLGNHDYFSDVNYISDVVKSETGIRMLRNEALLLDINGKPFSIMGTDDTRDSGGKSNPVVVKYITQTVNLANEQFKQKNIDASSVPKILLTHKPYLFDEVNDLNFDLMLSGHTHGGQVVFFKFGDLNLSFAAATHKYINGLYENNGKSLYVSRGIGTVGLPIRFNCPPEITKFTFV